jgi:hypothetical protein
MLTHQDGDYSSCDHWKGRDGFAVGSDACVSEFLVPVSTLVF